MFGSWDDRFIYGTFGDDALRGTMGNDYIFAFSGADKIYAGEGNDLVFAGRGHDIVNGGAGSDRIYAGRGNDSVNGGSGSDRVHAGGGHDRLVYIAGENTNAKDYYNGGWGTDTLELKLTTGEWKDTDFQTDYQAFTDYLSAGDLYQTFTFSSLGLTVRNIEQVEIKTPQTTATLVQTIDASAWLPPSPDPAGIVFVDQAGSLLVSDSEVNESVDGAPPVYFTGDNLFEIDLTGNLSDIHTTTGGGTPTTDFSDEPTGLAYNASNQFDRPSLFVSDDTGPRTVYELDSGPDRAFHTSDDIVSSYKLSDWFNTPNFLAYDPEGLTYDATRDALHIVDGAMDKVYSVQAVNGIFNDGDDLISSFDVSGYVKDAEGIAYDQSHDFLYVVGRDKIDFDIGHQVAQIDPVNGVFGDGDDIVTQIDISAADAKNPSGLAIGPSSIEGKTSLWVLDRGVDNNADPFENDGTVYEFNVDYWSWA